MRHGSGTATARTADDCGVLLCGRGQVVESKEQHQGGVSCTV